MLSSREFILLKNNQGDNMLQLSKEFFITSIKECYKWKSSILEQEYIYTFRYKNFKIELEIQFLIMGYTKIDNMAIINFGYIVDIEKWSDREQSFSHISDLDSTDGKSTKSYLDSQEARELLIRFIERRIDKYLNTVKPAILIRGALSEIKVNLPRYKRLDKLFFNYKYHKKELDINSSNSLYEISAGEKANDDKVIWVYSQDEKNFKKLNEVIK